jgi:hypothetical protein
MGILASLIEWLGETMSPLGIAIIGSLCFLLLWLLIDRFLNPLLARRRVGKLLKTVGKTDPRALESAKHGTLLADADGLRIKRERGSSLKLQWSEVEEVHAFKRDLFTTDLICLAFKKAGKEEYYEIHEEMAGYHDLLEILPTYLPKFTSDWFYAVAVPAFKNNHRIIWKRTPNGLNQ